MNAVRPRHQKTRGPDHCRQNPSVSSPPTVTNRNKNSFEWQTAEWDCATQSAPSVHQRPDPTAATSGHMHLVTGALCDHTNQLLNILTEFPSLCPTVIQMSVESNLSTGNEILMVTYNSGL